ncbi:MAG: hypothetical protein NW202_13430 [Nitrospira sp.]|nr:hypothetical protein [Nitrospira sp.]
MAFADPEEISSPTFRISDSLPKDQIKEDPVFDVDADEEGEPLAPLEYSDDDPNLVPIFEAHPDGVKEIKRLSNLVLRWFDDAWENTEEYRERMASDWAIFSGDLPQKPPPYENLSNPHVPAMLENLSRLQFHASDELFGDWTKVFGVLPIGADDVPIAEALSRHGNWQIRNQIPNFKRQFGHRGMLIFFVTGDVTAHSYYDFDRKSNAHDILTADEFVAPYVFVTTQPDYSDLPYYFKVLRLYRHQLQKYKSKWSNIDKVLDREAPSWDDEPQSKLRELEAEIKGHRAPDSNESAPYKLIWFEGWVKLIGQEDDRFMKIVVDKTTKTVVHMSIHEEVDWSDKFRFEQQTQELEAYRQAEIDFQAAQEAKQVEGQLLENVEQSDLSQMDPAGLDQLEQALMGMQQDPLNVQPPMPPGWMVDPSNPNEMPAPVKKVPIRLFSHGVCIEPLTGNLGIAPGRVQADLNRNMNIAMGMYMDASALANSWSIITTDMVSFEERFSISPGKVNKANGISAQELDKGIKELKPGPASEQLMNAVKMQWGWAASSIHSQDVMSGAPGKSGETYRGIDLRREQANKTLKVPTRKYADFITQVLKNNAALNAEFLPEHEMVLINDDKTMDYNPTEIRREWYQRSYRIEISSDLTFRSQQDKAQEAADILQIIASLPELATPGVALAFKWDALRRALEARGISDAVKLLGPPPPPDQVFGMPPMPPPVMPGQMPPGGGVPPGGAPPPQE